MFANIVVFSIWRKNPVTTFLSKSWQIQRTICTSARNKFYFSNINQVENKIIECLKDWNKIIAEAEKIIGCQISSLNPSRRLLTNKTANIKSQLIESNHSSVLKIAKIIINTECNTQYFGAIVMLISKAVDPALQHLHVKPIEEDKAAKILHDQKVLAEITEIIRASILIYRKLININKDTESSELDSIILNNKISLLYSDYLLSHVFSALASLRNQDLIFLMSSASKDSYQTEFVARRNNQNLPIPPVPPEDRTNYALKEWTLLNTHRAGLLLGKSCQGALKIASHSKEIEEKGYEFGKHFALAWQAFLDLGLCINKDKRILHNLCAAPIMFHVEHDPSILAELDKGLESIENVDYLKVLEIVAAGSGIGLTKELVKEHSQKAMEILSVFKESDARKALFNIIVAIGDF